jgi:hypothetical protein
LIAAAASSALATTDGATATSTTFDGLTVNYAAPAAGQAGAVLAGAAYFLKPKVGLRVGGGDWKEFMIDGGVDVTLNIPLIPLPGIRFDGEVWGKPSNFGKDQRGNAVSILGVQTFLVGYAGIGPTYYFTDDNGAHKSGFGAKLLVGMNLPLTSAYVEAGMIVGPSTPPIFVTIGMRF